MRPLLQSFIFAMYHTVFFVILGFAVIIFPDVYYFITPVAAILFYFLLFERLETKKLLDHPSKLIGIFLPYILLRALISLIIAVFLVNTYVESGTEISTPTSLHVALGTLYPFWSSATSVNMLLTVPVMVSIAIKFIYEGLVFFSVLFSIPLIKASESKYDISDEYNFSLLIKTLIFGGFVMFVIFIAEYAYINPKLVYKIFNIADLQSEPYAYIPPLIGLFLFSTVLTKVCSDEQIQRIASDRSGKFYVMMVVLIGSLFLTEAFFEEFRSPGIQSASFGEDTLTPRKAALMNYQILLSIIQGFTQYVFPSYLAAHYTYIRKFSPRLSSESIQVETQVSET